MANINMDSLNNLSVTPSTKGVTKIDPTTIPGFVPAKSAPNMKDYRVYYLKVNMDNPEDIGMLEDLETRAIRDEGVYILSNERFNFMDQILLLVKYIQKSDRAGA